ncbi:MAG: hypothetical protein IJ083_13295 [Clostridia bacterium]|nr:hypothetical protein [Clostridia bacterium]
METDRLMQGLRDAGCPEKEARDICLLRDNGADAQMLHAMKKQRCILVDEMHLSQRRVDHMDLLIRAQEARIKR